MLPQNHTAFSDKSPEKSLENASGTDNELDTLRAQVQHLEQQLRAATQCMQRAEAHAERMEQKFTAATTDSVTGLLNRALLDEILQAQFVKARGRIFDNLHVCVLDLDGLKPVNDTYGHQAGDDLLRHMADKLRQAFRLSSNDYALRLGGDEFVVLCTNVIHPSPIYEKLAGIQAEFSSTPVTVTDKQSQQIKLVPAGFSFGISSLKEVTHDNTDTITHIRTRATSSADLLREADANMYENKVSRRVTRNDQSALPKLVLGNGR